MQESVPTTPQPNVAVEVEPKVELKWEAEPDSQAEDGGPLLSRSAPSSSLSTCAVNTAAGHASLGLSAWVL